MCSMLNIWTLTNTPVIGSFLVWVIKPLSLNFSFHKSNIAVRYLAIQSELGPFCVVTGGAEGPITISSNFPFVK